MKAIYLPRVIQTIGALSRPLGGAERAVAPAWLLHQQLAALPAPVKTALGEPLVQLAAALAALKKGAPLAHEIFYHDLAHVQSSLGRINTAANPFLPLHDQPFAHDAAALARVLQSPDPGVHPYFQARAADATGLVTCHGLTARLGELTCGDKTQPSLLRAALTVIDDEIAMVSSLSLIALRNAPIPLPLQQLVVALEMYVAAQPQRRASSETTIFLEDLGLLTGKYIDYASTYQRMQIDLPTHRFKLRALEDLARCIDHDLTGVTHETTLAVRTIAIRRAQQHFNASSQDLKFLAASLVGLSAPVITENEMPEFYASLVDIAGMHFPAAHVQAIRGACSLVGAGGITRERVTSDLSYTQPFCELLRSSLTEARLLALHALADTWSLPPQTTKEKVARALMHLLDEVSAILGDSDSTAWQSHQAMTVAVHLLALMAKIGYSFPAESFTALLLQHASDIPEILNTGLAAGEPHPSALDRETQIAAARAWRFFTHRLGGMEEEGQPQGKQP